MSISFKPTKITFRSLIVVILIVFIPFSSKSLSINSDREKLWLSITDHKDDFSKLFQCYKKHNDINIKHDRYYSQTLIHRAVTCNNINALKILLRENINLNATNSLNSTPLHDAAEHGNLLATLLLLRHGACPNIIDAQSETPLFKAINNNYDTITHLLIAYGSCLNNKNRANATPLYLAVEQQAIDTIVLLLSIPSLNIEKKCKYGQTSLELAQESEQEIIMSIFKRLRPPNPRLKPSLAFNDITIYCLK